MTRRAPSSKLLLLPLMAAACLAGPAPAAPLLGGDTPWSEGDVPAPPAFSLDHLIEVPGSAASSLKTGIDPATLSIGADGVVRYVVAARSESAANILYEGIRCSSAEYRVYARYFEPGGWRPQPESSWQPLSSNLVPRHADRLAREGVCTGASANTSPAQIVRDLRSSPVYGSP